MHGLINRALQCFLRDTYGPSVWTKVALASGVGVDGFEPLLSYDDALTEAVIVKAADQLQRPRETVLEDLGTYLVSHPNLESLRRLLRFGGVSFVDFLHSLEDLPEHGRLGLPDLDLPEFQLVELGQGAFRLTVTPMIAGTGHVLVGLLRAMADDYGALVLLEHCGLKDGREEISVDLLDSMHADGRRFDLAATGS
jgi:hypothetical protein